jgi:hypothetical protein
MERRSKSHVWYRREYARDSAISAEGFGAARNGSGENMKRTYELVVETSDHPNEHPYLVTLWENHSVLMAHRASSLAVCMAAVVERVIADDSGPK